MEAVNGFLRELKHQAGEPVSYSIATESDSLDLNDALGKRVSISFLGRKKCIACGRNVKKLYQSGYCYPCLTTLAECDLCIVKPHECHFHLGTCRDETFAHDHCMIPHYVYLALSSHVKVGLTRKGRELTRWVDQGASAAVVVAEVPTRKDAGVLEMAIAEFLPDKTDWRRMLRGDIDTSVDLLEMKRTVMERLDPSWHAYFVDDEVRHFTYPRKPDFEPKLTSWSLDKSPVIEGSLLAVKGQYLMFQDGVLNIKKHAGYEVKVSVS